MDITEAEYVDIAPKIQLHKVLLNILDENDKNTIFNVIIMEENKESINGTQ